MNLPENIELQFDSYCGDCPVRDIVLEERLEKNNPLGPDSVVITCSHYYACERLYNMKVYESEVA